MSYYLSWLECHTNQAKEGRRLDHFLHYLSFYNELVSNKIEKGMLGKLVIVFC